MGEERTTQQDSCTDTTANDLTCLSSEPASHDQNKNVSQTAGILVPSSNAPIELKDDNKRGKTDLDTLTDATADSEKPINHQPTATNEIASENKIVISSNRNSRPIYKYDPNKITLRFLFANRDGLTVTVECKPSDTVGEVKGALISVWPRGEFLPTKKMFYEIHYTIVKKLLTS